MSGECGQLLDFIVCCRNKIIIVRTTMIPTTTDDTKPVGVHATT